MTGIILFIVLASIVLYAMYVVYLMCRFLKLTDLVAATYEEICMQRDTERNAELCEKTKNLVEEALNYYYKLCKFTFKFDSIEHEKKYLDLISDKIKSLQKKGS